LTGEHLSSRTVLLGVNNGDCCDGRAVGAANTQIRSVPGGGGTYAAPKICGVAYDPRDRTLRPAIFRSRGPMIVVFRMFSHATKHINQSQSHRVAVEHGDAVGRGQRRDHSSPSFCSSDLDLLCPSRRSGRRATCLAERPRTFMTRSPVAWSSTLGSLNSLPALSRPSRFLPSTPHVAATAVQRLSSQSPGRRDWWALVVVSLSRDPVTRLYSADAGDIVRRGADQAHVDLPLRRAANLSPRYAGVHRQGTTPCYEDVTGPGQCTTSRIFIGTNAFCTVPSSSSSPPAPSSSTRWSRCALRGKMPLQGARAAGSWCCDGRGVHEGFNSTCSSRLLGRRPRLERFPLIRSPAWHAYRERRRKKCQKSTSEGVPKRNRESQKVKMILSKGEVEVSKTRATMACQAAACSQ
jgi:hypothetical protein